MNRRTTLTLTALAFLCLGIVLPLSDALGQQKSFKELIVGTWFLDSVYDQTQDGEKHNPWGDGVKGQAIFTSDGHFSWQMMSANRAKADTSPREPVGPVVAYWGTYTVDEAAKTLTDHLERCTFPRPFYPGEINENPLSACPGRISPELCLADVCPRSEHGKSAKSPATRA